MDSSRTQVLRALLVFQSTVNERSRSTPWFKTKNSHFKVLFFNHFVLISSFPIVVRFSELIRSLHVYRSEDGKEYEVGRESSFPAGGSYTEMEAHPTLILLNFRVSKVFEGLVNGFWLCIFAFHADRPPRSTCIPSLLTMSRMKRGESITSGTEPTSSQIMLDRIKKALFKNTMRGKWNQIVEIYRNNPEAHTFKITKSEETALHIVISENKEQIVKALIELILAQPNGKDALKIQNKKRDTPLHFAAAVGSVDICKRIVEADSSSVGVTNSKGETPLFVAALQGKKEAFLYLHSICRNNLVYAMRWDGDTILHCTIARAQFDLAFQIIHWYGKRLVDCVNQEGMSPLHQLASKPTAFKSGYQMGPMKSFIYDCISVDELNVEASDQQSTNEMNQNNEGNVNNQKCHNYTLCIKLFHFFRNVFQAITSFRHKRQPDVENPERAEHQGSHIPPPNLSFARRVFERMLIVRGLGPTTVRKMKEEKQKHRWAVQIMNELLRLTSIYEDDGTNGRSRQLEEAQKDETKHEVHGGETSFDLPQTKYCVGEGKNVKYHEKYGETPLLLAAEYGIIEIVEEILKQFPFAKYDRDENRKNIVLVVAEYRQPHIYQLLLQKYRQIESLFRKLDKDGNSALHLAAKLGDYKPWDTPGAALQMQWELTWYELVRKSMPPQLFPLINNKGETPKDVFRKTHKDLIKEGRKWLTKTSESCSVVAALIATVAFTTSSTVPGGIKGESGTPTLENQPAFHVFAISSAVALYFSIIALLLFLGIATTQYEEMDFGKQLTRSLLIGLTSLSISIASVLTSFCAGDFFVLKGKLGYAAYPMFAGTFFAVVQFRLYFKVMLATFKKLSKRNPRGLVLELEL